MLSFKQNISDSVAAQNFELSQGFLIFARAWPLLLERDVVDSIVKKMPWFRDLRGRVYLGDLTKKTIKEFSGNPYLASGDSLATSVFPPGVVAEILKARFPDIVDVSLSFPERSEGLPEFAQCGTWIDLKKSDSSTSRIAMYLPVDHVSPYFNFVSYDDFGKKTVSELLNWIEEKGMANRLNLEAQAFVRDSGIHDYFFRSVKKMFDSLSNSWEQRKMKRNGQSVDTQSEQKR